MIQSSDIAVRIEEEKEYVHKRQEDNIPRK